MIKEERMRWVPFTGDRSQLISLRLENARKPGPFGLAEWRRRARHCIRRLASDELRLVRIAKPDPCALRIDRHVIEQCLPEFWQLPEHDNVHGQILERDQDDKWRYALVSTSAVAKPEKAGDYRIDPQAGDAVLPRPWCPLSQCLRYVAAISGNPEDSWPEVSSAISEGRLRARGTCFAIDHQPLQPEWMRIRMWDDAKDDAIFFRKEKGSDLVPPQPVPGHITNIEVCTADIERRWPPNAKEAAMSSPADMGFVAGAEGEPIPMSISEQQGKRGPKPGSLNRYGDADKGLFCKVEEIMRREKRSANAAALQLAENGEVAGIGTAKSRAKRLASRYLDYKETRGN